MLRFLKRTLETEPQLRRAKDTKKQPTNAFGKSSIVV